MKTKLRHYPFFIQQGVILTSMAAFKRHCAFGFWGPEMKKVLAKDGLNDGYGMGSLGRITELAALPPDRVLFGYMSQAADFVESGSRTKSIDRSKRPAKKATRVPPELTAALKKNKMATKVFLGFSPNSKREYADWIAHAKRPETKAKRVKQAVEWIAEGKQRNWKYMNC
jgi:Bacteriocin-protection, YdeI or OmpD-Associated